MKKRRLLSVFLTHIKTRTIIFVYYLQDEKYYLRSVGEDVRKVSYLRLQF